MSKLYLYLENGDYYRGESFGHKPESPRLSELVFNTSMYGYQEIISDPSYCDQAIVMTYPLIGNYGVNQDDSESITPHLNAFITREYCDHPSNFRSRQNLSQYLETHKIIGIHQIDTRKLTKIIRTQGTLKCVISSNEMTESELSDFFSTPYETNQIEKVSIKTISHFPALGGKRIVLVDFGYKKNILESLLKRGCDVIVVPFDTSFEKIAEFNPKGIVLSNGPGDPKSIEKVLPTIRKLQESFPMFSICMGHQIFALANGADTIKMKFGHRGGNHPVHDLERDKVFITAQNHGYCVREDSLGATDLEVTQVNLNDKTIEGLKHKTLPAYSVQYHPEASPGPNDTKYLFDQFIESLSEDQYAQR
ncbi:MAG: carbamoyl phosphate synthase small subunit [Halobacteriovoraceae bacterium]|nr:carbamoyl phosphate synthase small subunit [Halobacteriovoraceae bacterium]|tara:strand:+ start:6093 stop:7184 length:1092 start_codon:yes stop_codon:yes gene_type:complete